MTPVDIVIYVLRFIYANRTPNNNDLHKWLCFCIISDCEKFRNEIIERRNELTIEDICYYYPFDSNCELYGRNRRYEGNNSHEDLKLPNIIVYSLDEIKEMSEHPGFNTSVWSTFYDINIFYLTGYNDYSVLDFIDGRPESGLKIFPKTLFSTVPLLSDGTLGKIDYYAMHWFTIEISPKIIINTIRKNTWRYIKRILEDEKNKNSFSDDHL